MAQRYRPDKFAELVLFIARESAEDSQFGEMKLHKLLYLSDFRAYARWGEPITGASYVKSRYGPSAHALASTLDELCAADRARVNDADGPPLPQRSIEARDEPRESAFSPDELDIVCGVIDEFRDASAAEVGNASHNAPGWQLARDGEEIPYFTVLIDPTIPPDDIKREASTLAERHGWFTPG